MVSPDTIKSKLSQWINLKLNFFFQMKDEFDCVNIDIDNGSDNDLNRNKIEIVNETDDNQEEIEILQLKDKVLPRGLVPLEEIFDFNDLAKKLKFEPVGDNVE